jgi:CDGSH-type Zn-finger protein
MPGVRIVALPGGPLRVEGECSVVDLAGNPFPAREGKKPGVYLCRCGHSALKPWCDGSHKRVGFEGSEPAPLPDPPA